MIIHQGKFLNLHREPAPMPNGHILDMEVIKGIRASAVISLNEAEDQIILVYQFRPAANSWFWEIPCGRIEEGEDPLIAAQRELEEETGYKAIKTEFLISMNPCIGYSDEVIHIYKGVGFTEGRRHLDDSEVIEVHVLGKKDVIQMIRDKKIVDPKTILAITLVWLV